VIALEDHADEVFGQLTALFAFSAHGSLLAKPVLALPLIVEQRKNI